MKHDTLSYPQLFNELEELNTSCFDFILNEDFDGFENTVNTFIESGITELENFDTAKRMYKYAYIPLKINNNFYGKSANGLTDRIWNQDFGTKSSADYFRIDYIKDNYMNLTTLAQFISTHGYDEYEAEKYDDDNKRPSYIKKRRDAIIKYIDEYKDLFLDNTIFKNNAVDNVKTYQQEYINKVIKLVELREHFFITYNFLLFDEAAHITNKLKGLSLKDKLDKLSSLDVNVFANGDFSPTGIRNYIKIIEDKPIIFSNYIQGKYIDRKNWKNYKKCIYAKNPLFYLELAFYLCIPSSDEIEKFMNLHGYSIKSNLLDFKDIIIGKETHHIMHKDICKWIDAGVSYELINEILGFEIEIKEVKKTKNKSK